MSLEAIFAILAGIILLTGLFGVIPALGEYLDKFGKFLGGFQGIIGIIALILGVLAMLDPLKGATLLNIFLIIAGIMLAAGILQALPMAGEQLKKMAMFLGGFQTIIGIITLIVGILAL